MDSRFLSIQALASTAADLAGPCLLFHLSSVPTVSGLWRPSSSSSLAPTTFCVGSSPLPPMSSAPLVLHDILTQYHASQALSSLSPLIQGRQGLPILPHRSHSMARAVSNV